MVMSFYILTQRFFLNNAGITVFDIVFIFTAGYIIKRENIVLKGATRRALCLLIFGLQ